MGSYFSLSKPQTRSLLKGTFFQDQVTHLELDLYFNPDPSRYELISLWKNPNNQLMEEIKSHQCFKDLFGHGKKYFVDEATIELWKHKTENGKSGIIRVTVPLCILE